MAESVRTPVLVRWVDGQGRQANSTRVLKSTIDRDYEALLQQVGSPAEVANALVAGDPEIDPETVGTFLRDTSRVFINSDRKIVYGVTQIEIVRNPDGTEKARRPKKSAMPNVNAEQPLMWSGKLLPKRDVFNKFVFVSKLQVVHINGLTYDFLMDIARHLEEKKSLLLVGAGPKANQPLILRHGSLPYRAFLEGRTRGDEYCLLMHLSNIELKAPEVQAPAAEGARMTCSTGAGWNQAGRVRGRGRDGPHRPMLVPRIQDYRRQIAGRMVPLEPDQIIKRFPAADYLVSLKVDGEFDMLVYQDGDAVLANPGGPSGSACR